MARSVQDENVRRINAHLERIEGVLKTLTAAVGAISRVLKEEHLVSDERWMELVAEKEDEIDEYLIQEAEDFWGMRDNEHPDEDEKGLS